MNEVTSRAPTAPDSPTPTEFLLSVAMAQELRDAGARVAGRGVGLAVGAREVAATCMGELRGRLQQFAEYGSTGGFLLLRGLDVGAVPLTPLDNIGSVAAGTVLGPQQAIISEMLGYLVGYAAEADGSLLQDLVPNPRLIDSQQSQGSRVELEAHTEQAFSDLRPDFVVLGCLRGDPVAATFLLDARSLIGDLTTSDVAMLRQSVWWTSVDDSFVRGGASSSQRGPMAVIAGDAKDPLLRLDLDMMRGSVSGADAVLERCGQSWRRHRRSITLAPGEVLVIDNSRAMHGRAPFTARFDGSDRFLCRSMVRRTPPPPSAIRSLGARVILADAS